MHNNKDDSRYAKDKKPAIKELSKILSDNFLLTFFTVASFGLRLWRLGEPSEVAFDEVHFGGFASHYLKREYFFDVHPPLGKMLFALVGWVMGFAGNFNFEKISMSYVEKGVPYIAMRLLPAICGSLIVPLTWIVMRDLNVSQLGVVLTCFMLLLDGSLITNCRYILLDPLMMVSIAAACVCWIKFRKSAKRSFNAKNRNHIPLDPHTLGWLFATGISIAVATSIKLVGLSVVGLIGVCTIHDLWELADYKKSLSLRQIQKHFVVRFQFLLLIPIAFFVFTYFPHFLILNRSGPGDDFMSAEFQSTLINNKMYAEGRIVYYGSNVTLLSKVEEIYLHSHLHRYPLEHIEGKYSSEGQQVTGYSEADDVNNIWIILPAEDVNQSYATEKIAVKQHDLIRLKHFSTESYLLTQNAASTNTLTHQEVTTVKEGERYPETLWKLDISRGGSTLKSRISSFRLIHNETLTSLTNYPMNLPEWGFSQREINAFKNGNDETTFWGIASTSSPFGSDAAEEKSNANIKKDVKTPNFFEKFLELFQAAINANSRLVDTHPSSTGPSKWPLGLRGISYWENGDTQRVFMLGNPMNWWLGIFSVLAYTLIAAVDQMTTRRGVELFNGHSKKFFYEVGGFFYLGWVLHYIPFYFMGRSLYIHHYLPAFVFSACLTGCLAHIVVSNNWIREMWAKAGIVLIVNVIVWMFAHFMFLTYGMVVDRQVFTDSQWFATWDFVK